MQSFCNISIFILQGMCNALLACFAMPLEHAQCNTLSAADGPVGDMPLPGRAGLGVLPPKK
jgi:hypothetical protein